MSQATECPKCQHVSVVHGFNVGRSVCDVCIDCGWCVVHSNYWPSVVKSNERRAAIAVLEAEVLRD